MAVNWRNAKLGFSIKASFRGQSPTPWICGALPFGMCVCCWLLVFEPAVAETPIDVARSVAKSPDATQAVVIELFYRGDSEQSQRAERYFRGLGERRAGVTVKAYDVLEDRVQLKRLWSLSKRFGHEKAGLPAVYACDRLHLGFRDEATSGRQVDDLLTIKAYVRPGCKHCRAGKAFLDNLVRRWPALKVEYYDVVADPAVRVEVQQLAARYRVRVPSFPCIEVAGRLIVGFQSEDITGRQIESYFLDRSRDTPQREGEPNGDASSNHRLRPGGVPSLGAPMVSSLVSYLPWQGAPSGQEDGLSSEAVDELLVPEDLDDVVLPVDVEPIPAEVTLPEDSPGASASGDVLFESSTADRDAVEVPVLGQLSVRKLGLPAFTFLIGLVDGFNPCAMWVLVFLLSMLVRMKERKKILVVAGTFVVVSGLAYFVFMAAWFSVFQLIGLLRPVQIGLGVVAMVIGVVNIKDFFALHRGFSFSIPESAKPGIYRRVRQIVATNYLTSALLGAIVLAILVNIVELLCTAGLPALYTEVLAMQNLPTWANYSYLGLYILAYMLDDTLLVGAVVATLSHRRLQESEGRWLKLLSGAVVLTLGVVMVFAPQMLI